MTAINEAHDTVILAMHDVDLALAFTDRVIGLKGGHIVLDSPSLGLKQSDLDSLYKN